MGNNSINAQANYENERHLFQRTVFFKHFFPSGNRKAGIQGTVLLQGDYNVLTISSSTGSGCEGCKCKPWEQKKEQGLRQ